MESGDCTNIDKNVDQTQPQRHVLAVPRFDHPGYHVSEDGTSSDGEDQSSINQKNPVNKDLVSDCSVYSYQSIRDRQQFMKLTNGRYVFLMAYQLY
jgi:hypothetical protein